MNDARDTNGKKLLLADGSNLLFQMFFGMPARIVNADGKPVHAVLGFVGALLKIIRMTAPTHIAVLFDGEHRNPRTALDAQYKANRPDYSRAEGDCPFDQLSDIYAALDRLCIKHAETTECETDDWMAAYALALGKTLPVVISSFDSDYFQLLTDSVSVLRYRGVKTTLYTPDVIRERLGIPPELYADFKALTGDPSDNIKGARNVGPKTAAALLNTFGSLDGVIANAARIHRPSVARAVLDSAERLRINYKLIKLTDGARLPFRLDELAFDGVKYGATELLRDIGVLP